MSRRSQRRVTLVSTTSPHTVQAPERHRNVTAKVSELRKGIGAKRVTCPTSAPPEAGDTAQSATHRRRRRNRYVRNMIVGDTVFCQSIETSGGGDLSLAKIAMKFGI